MAEPSTFILASASPRRRELLAQVGLSFEVVPSHVDESLLPGETPEAHTRRLAQAKAEAVAERHPGRWILGADTTVVIDGAILGKPADVRDAERMLGLIAGRTHTVVSSFCILAQGRPERIIETSKSLVFMRSLTPEAIRWYVSTGEPMDKAGAYAVQGIGACLVERIEGSYTNVVGLPLAEAVRALERLGLVNFSRRG